MSALRKTLQATSATPACPSRARPIDLVHLACQTAGDRGLEGEVLGLMARQIGLVQARIAAAGEEEGRAMAHALKGAARSVGAFALAAAAEAVETQPAQPCARAGLGLEMARTAAFIRSLER